MDKSVEERRLALVTVTYDAPTGTRTVSTKYASENTRTGLSIVGSRTDTYCGDQAEVDAIIEAMNK